MLIMPISIIFTTFLIIIIGCIPLLLNVERVGAEWILVDGGGRVEVVAVKPQRVDRPQVDLVDADHAVPEPRLVLELDGRRGPELLGCNSI